MSVSTDDLLSRHLVLQKAKILKGKTRIMEVKKTGLVLMSISPYVMKKQFYWNDIIDVSLGKNESEFTITVSLKKKTTTFSTDSRVALLSDLFSMWKRDDRKLYNVEKQTKHGQRIFIEMQVNPTNYVTSHKGGVTRFQHVKRILKVTSNEDAFVIHSTPFRKQLLHSDQREAIVQTIQDNMKKYLGLVLKVETVDDVSDLFSLTDESLDIVFDTPATKHKPVTDSLTQKDRMRKIGLDKKSIYEIDPNTKKVLSMYRFREIQSLVRVEDSDAELIIQYGTHSVKYDLSTRDDLISSIIELAERERVVIPVNSKQSVAGVKLGAYDEYYESVYDILIKNLATLKPQADMEQYVSTLAEFVENYSINSPFAKGDKKALQFLNTAVQYYLHLKDRPNPRDLILTLQTMYRILSLPAVFESISGTYRDVVKFLAVCMKMDHPYIAYLAAAVYKLCTDQMYTHKNDKTEVKNKAVFLNEECLHILFGILSSRVSAITQYTLFISTVVAILENSVGSGKSSTDKNAMKTILESIAKHMNLLFAVCYRSRSLAVTMNSSVVLRVGVQTKIADKTLSGLQLDWLKSTKLLQQIYICVSSRDKDQVLITSDIIGFMVEGCSESLAVLQRILPRPLFQHLEKKRAASVQYLNKKVHAVEKPSVPSHPVTMILPKLNWFEMFTLLTKDVTSASVIWHDKTRAELKAALAKEVREYEAFVHKNPEKHVVWNHEEFSIVYDSLANEPKVGGYYLLPFITNSTNLGWGKEDRIIDDPKTFSEKLHHTIMFTTDIELKKLCLRASSEVYTFYKHDIGPYAYINHICMLLKGATDLGLISEILSFITQLLTVYANVEPFIELGGVDIALSLVTLIHDSSEFIQPQEAKDQQIISARICQSCLTILLRLATFHSSVDDNGRILVPTPIAKVLMSDPNVLPHIVQLLLAHEQGRLVLSTVSLLNQLVPYNDEIIKSLYQTGLFNFLFLYAGDSAADIITLLKAVHKEQDLIIDEIPTGGASDYSPPIKSVLNSLLPKELIYRLDTMGTNQLAELFTSDSISTPLLIWNSEMREHLKQHLLRSLTPFIENLRSNRTAVYQFEAIPPVEYERLQDEFVCYHYYIKNFVRTESWPTTFEIEEVEKLSKALSSSMEANFIANSGFDQSLVDHMSLCLRSQLILLQKTKQQVFASFSGYSQLVECMKRANNSSFSSPHQVQLEYQLMTLIYELATFSSANIDSLLSTNIIVLICTLLSRCTSQLDISNVSSKAERIQKLDQHFQQRLEQLGETQQRLNIESPRSPRSECVENDKNVEKGDEFCLEYLNHDEKLFEVAEICLTTLLLFAQYRDDSVGVMTESNTLITSITKVLQYPDEKALDTIDTSLNLLSSLFVISTMQDRAFASGLHIYLLSYILEFSANPNKYTTTVDLCVKCLRRLAGWSSQDQLPDKPCPANSLIQKSLRQLLPNHLIDSMIGNSASTFMTHFRTKREGPVVLWNNSTIKDLFEFLEGERTKLSNGTFDSSSLLAFTYKTCNRELQATNIFIRLYNESAQTFTLELPADFAKQCCIQLKDEWALVEKRNSIDLLSYQLSRVTILLEALYNCLSTYVHIRRETLTIVDFWPILVDLVRADLQFSKCFYYLLHILYMLVEDIGQEVVTLLVKSNLIIAIRNLFSTHQSSPLPEIIADIHDGFLTLLYKLVTKDERNNVIQLIVDSGLFVYLLAEFTEVSRIHDLSRSKTAFLLSQIASNNNSVNLLKKYIPPLLAEVIQKNPSDSVQIFEKLHEYPEFIWNQEMRTILKSAVEKQLEEILTAIEKNPNATYTIADSFQIVYSYPRMVSGLYVTMYNNNANYPVPDFAGFIAALMNDIKNNSSQEQREESLQAVFLCLGAEYFNKSTVPLMSQYVGQILEIVKDETETDSMKQKAVRIISKMSNDVTCISKLSDIASILDDFCECMKAMPDQLEEWLFIIMRILMKNRMLLDKVTDDSALAQFLFQIGESSHGSNVKSIAARFLKFLSQTQSGIFEQLQQIGLYEAIEAFRNEDAFKSLLAPPIHPGGTLGYMGISLNKKDENTNEANSLFNYLLKDIVLITKLLAAEKERIQEHLNKIMQENQPVVQPPKQQQEEKLEVNYAIPQANLHEETEAEEVDEIQEEPSVNNEMPPRTHLPPLPTPDTKQVAPQTFSPNAPPPPPPGPAPKIETNLNTGRRSISANLLSDIQRGKSLKSAEQIEKDPLPASPVASRQSLGTDLMKGLTQRRQHIEDDSEDSDVDTD